MKVLRGVEVAGAALVAVLALAGCGSDDGDGGGATVPVPADLDGTTYTSTGMSGQELVDGSTLRVSFDDGTMGVSADCNTMSSAYAVSEGVLAWSGQPASTMKACSDELTAQDQWLTQAFTDGFDVTLDGSRMTLMGDEVTIELEEQE